MLRKLCLLLIMAVVICSCEPKDESVSTKKSGEKTMELKITSPAFTDGALIPSKYTADGANVSPPLAWTGVPETAKSLALINDDPDAPMGTWVHWVVYNIPADTASFDENIPPDPTLPSGAMQGKTDFGRIGYGGPAPPSGTHRYYFKLYALDAVLDLPTGATKAQLETAMKNHILEQTQIMGKYKRK